MRIVSTHKDYRGCLEKLAAAPPKRRVALTRSLLPGIEAALTSGRISRIFGKLSKPKVCT